MPVSVVISMFPIPRSPSGGGVSSLSSTVGGASRSSSKVPVVVSGSIVVDG